MPWATLKILELVDAKSPEYLYKNYDDVIAKIKEEHKFDNTQKNKFAACNSIIKCYITTENKSEVENAIQKYIDEINILKNKIKTDLKTHIASSKEKESWLTKEQAKKLDSILDSKVKDKIENYDDFISIILKYAKLLINISYTVVNINYYSDLINTAFECCDTPYLTIVGIMDKHDINFIDICCKYLDTNPNIDITFSSYNVSEHDYSECITFEQNKMIFASNFSQFLFYSRIFLWELLTANCWL